MNNFTELLPNIIEKIKKYHSLYEQNEMAVRDQIINPILRMLDWDTENPEDVQPNMTFDEGFPDYTLLKGEKKILFIEAKKLSVDIGQSNTIRQLAKYSFGEGTKYGILTNGAAWVLIRSFEEGTKLTERTIWKTDLENDEFPTIVRKLTTISKNNIENIEILVKKQQILDEIWQSLSESPQEIINGLKPVVKLLIAQNYPEYQFEDLEIEDLLVEKVQQLFKDTNEIVENYYEDSQLTSNSYRNNKVRSPKPKRMKLYSDSYELHSAKDVLMNTANWLIKNGKLKYSDAPIDLGGHIRYLINKEPKHKNKSPFKQATKLSNGLWIETHAGTEQLIEYSRRLLEKLGVPPDKLVIN
ncbi:MAG TPA: hypothetical protein PLC04_01935 [Candidatus Kapabacteria bacterium]|nr:hypothetical protein [Candidatus Kapabacteria bacterium]